MEYRQLVHFLAICSERSFSKAALRCFISQQGLSRSIQSLEDELGMPLFLRTTKGVKLTREGEVLREAAPDYIEHHDKLLSMMQALHVQHESRIRLAMINGFSKELPRDFICTFLLENPGLYLDIASFEDNKIREAIAEQHIELAFLEGPVDDKIFKTWGMRKRKLYLICSENHRFAKLKSIRMRDIKGEQIININRNKFWDNLWLKEGLKASIFLSQSEASLAHQLCRANRAVFFGQVPRDLQRGLAAVEIEDLDTDLEIDFVSNRANELNKGARCFIDYVCNSDWTE
jgi:DNA-binding transcriptional LysR family regulator